MVKPSVDIIMIVSRVEKLEKENRRWKLVGMLGVGILCFVLLTGAQQTAPQVMRAKEIVLVNDEGKTMADLSFKESLGPQLSFYNGQSVAVTLGAQPSGPLLFMHHDGGTAIISADSDGARFYVSDKRGFSAALGNSELTTTTRSAASITLARKDGKVLWSAP